MCFIFYLGLVFNDQLVIDLEYFYDVTEIVLEIIQ